jgi:hypothetical protein
VQCTHCTGTIKKIRPPKVHGFVLIVGHGLGNGAAVGAGAAVGVGVTVGVGIRDGALDVSIRWTLEYGIAIN